ncbi:MAG: hypothetical protein IH602_16860 [Bryobacteraceae bacterium]|nr:hypothetical protein [Bryobacteraceae bacterium]
MGRVWSTLSLETSQYAVEMQHEVEMKTDDRIARIRHDLLGPLHSISGFLELLDEELAGGRTPSQRRCLENLHLALDRLTGRVNLLSEGSPSTPGSADRSEESK